jgi:hypothetical protein
MRLRAYMDASVALLNGVVFLVARVDPTATRISTEKVLRLPVASANQGAARGAGKVHETPGVGQESVAMQRTSTIP